MENGNVEAFDDTQQVRVTVYSPFGKFRSDTKKMNMAEYLQLKKLVRQSNKLDYFQIELRANKSLMVFPSDVIKQCVIRLERLGGGHEPKERRSHGIE